MLNHREPYKHTQNGHKVHHSSFSNLWTAQRVVLYGRTYSSQRYRKWRGDHLYHIITHTISEVQYFMIQLKPQIVFLHKDVEYR